MRYTYREKGRKPAGSCAFCPAETAGPHDRKESFLLARNRNYSEEYAREREYSRRLTVRLPLEMAEAFTAKCEADGINPADWVRNKILEYVRADIDLGLVQYQGFVFDWHELISEMDPLIFEELRASLPSDVTNEEFLEHYGDMDPSIYDIIDPFGADGRIRPDEEEEY